jgi:hypothetical protein
MDGMCNFALQHNIPFGDLLLSVVRQWLQHTPRLSISSAPLSATSSPKGAEGEAKAEEVAVKQVEHNKILVVEDNAMNQIVVSTFLKKAGYPTPLPSFFLFIIYLFIYIYLFI